MIAVIADLPLWHTCKLLIVALLCYAAWVAGRMCADAREAIAASTRSSGLLSSVFGSWVLNKFWFVLQDSLLMWFGGINPTTAATSVSTGSLWASTLGDAWYTLYTSAPAGGTASVRDASFSSLATLLSGK
jgi:hypothetical protein